jgi:hypothetical protein
MTQTLSRLMSAATAGYAAYALTRPEHLGRVMQADGAERHFYDQVARGYGVRDLAISALGLTGPARAVPVAIVLRIAGDLTDGAFLGSRAPNGQVRAKVLGATLGWAALNLTALVVDRRRT